MGKGRENKHNTTIYSVKSEVQIIHFLKKVDFVLSYSTLTISWCGRTSDFNLTDLLHGDIYLGALYRVSR